MEELLAVALPTPDLMSCARGVGLYAKHLDAMAKEAATLGRSQEAGKYESEAAALRAEIVEPAEAGEKFTLYGRHRPIVEKGLELLVKNVKAAKGTLKPLGYDDVIATLEADAAHVEGAILPLFRLQGELPLEEGDRPVRLVRDDVEALHAAAQAGE